MGCERGEVTQENLKYLKSLEEVYYYPPRLEIQFQRDSNIVQNKNEIIQVKFTNVDPTTAAFKIILKTKGMKS